MADSAGSSANGQQRPPAPNGGEGSSSSRGRGGGRGRGRGGRGGGGRRGRGVGGGRGGGDAVPPAYSPPDAFPPPAAAAAAAADSGAGATSGGRGGGGGSKGGRGQRGGRVRGGRGKAGGTGGGGDVEGTVVAAASAEVSSHAGDCCIVCTEPLDAGKHRPAAGACEHRQTCALCFMRLRLLVKDMSCPVCKAPLESVFVFDSPQDTRPFASLLIWGTEAGPGWVHDDRAQLFMPRAFMEGVFKPIQAPGCPMPGCGTHCRSLPALRDHLRAVHEKRAFCDVCLEHKKVFVGEQQVYTKGELQRHMEKGEPSQGFTGHPACRFCKHKRLYDMSALYIHLREEHWACTICQRDRGVQHTYYRDYPDLERHFRQEHHLCEEPQCLAARFVVFGHALDLHAHVLNTHPERVGQQQSRRQQQRLELDVTAFRIRGQQGEEEGEGEEEQGPEEGWAVDGNNAVGTAVAQEAFPELSAAATRAGLGRAPSGGGAPSSRGSQQPAFPPLGGGGGMPAATARRSSTAASANAQRPTALAAARALLQPMPPVVRRPTNVDSSGPWGGMGTGGRVPATVAASQALLQAQRQQQQQQQQEKDGGGGGGGGGVDDGVVHRNRRFADALGITEGIEGQARAALLATGGDGGGVDGGAQDAFRLDLERPVYPRELLQWAGDAATKGEVARLEERIAAFLGDRKEASLYLKPMPREERRRIHLLAEFYGLKSVSYDNDPRRFVALIKAPGTKPAVPVMTLTQTAAAEHAALLLNNSSARRPLKPATPPLTPFGPTTPGATATVLVSHLGELSGKAVTDRLRTLFPTLPLCGYRRHAPPSAPQDADRSREILVVELATAEAASALLERAARRPDVVQPLQLRAGVGVDTAAAAAPSTGGPERMGTGGESIVRSSPKPLASFPPPLADAGGGGEGGGGGVVPSDSGAGGRWGHSVLAGRLKPRSLPVATTERTTLASMIEQQQRKGKEVKVTKARRGGGGGVNGRLAAVEEELPRPGQAVRANRWEGLLSDGDSDEENEEDRAKVAVAGGKEAVRENEGAASPPAPAPVPEAEPEAEADESEEQREQEEEGEEEEEEEEEVEVETTCRMCTYVYFSGDYCPMCSHPRK